MGCGCSKNRGSPDNVPLKPMFKEDRVSKADYPETKNGPVKNLIKAGLQQPDKTKWFLTGVKNLGKAILGDNIYTEDDVRNNIDICRGCEFSTKNESGRLTVNSQCMAKDPATGAPCGCFIKAKARTDVCPLNKWTSVPLTVNKQKTLEN